jgi:hypothetical protein
MERMGVEGNSSSVVVEAVEGEWEGEGEGVLEVAEKEGDPWEETCVEGVVRRKTRSGTIRRGRTVLSGATSASLLSSSSLSEDISTDESPRAVDAKPRSSR